MPYLSERDSISPLIILEDNTSQYVIILISIIMISLFICWIIYTITKGTSTNVYFGTCPVGECPTNLATGEKRCSTNLNDSLIYNQSTEVCNPRYSCNDARTKYALQMDGSTNSDGKCEDGIFCRCTNTQYCPSYATTIFTMTNGSSYLGSDYIIRQEPVLNSDNYGIDSIVVNNTNTEFCKINTTSLNLLTPNTCTISSVPTLAEVTSCVNNNFCTVGVPAYVVPDASKFNPKTDFNYYPLTCVLGTSCSGNSLPVFDERNGKVTCVSYTTT